MDLGNLPDALIDVLRGYATLSPIRTLKFPHELLFYQIHDFLLNSILLHPFFTTYAPSPQYQQQFWKWALEHLEAHQIDQASKLDAACKNIY